MLQHRHAGRVPLKNTHEQKAIYTCRVNSSGYYQLEGKRHYLDRIAAGKEIRIVFNDPTPEGCNAEIREIHILSDLFIHADGSRKVLAKLDQDKTCKESELNLPEFLAEFEGLKTKRGNDYYGRIILGEKSAPLNNVSDLYSLILSNLFKTAGEFDIEFPGPPKNCTKLKILGQQFDVQTKAYNTVGLRLRLVWDKTSNIFRHLQTEYQVASKLPGQEEILKTAERDNKTGGGITTDLSLAELVSLSESVKAYDKRKFTYIIEAGSGHLKYRPGSGSLDKQIFSTLKQSNSFSITYPPALKSKSTYQWLGLEGPRLTQGAQQNKVSKVIWRKGENGELQADEIIIYSERSFLDGSKKIQERFNPKTMEVLGTELSLIELLSDLNKHLGSVKDGNLYQIYQNGCLLGEITAMAATTTNVGKLISAALQTLDEIRVDGRITDYFTCAGLNWIPPISFTYPAQASVKFKYGKAVSAVVLKDNKIIYTWPAAAETQKIDSVSEFKIPEYTADKIQLEIGSDEFNELNVNLAELLGTASEPTRDPAEIVKEFEGSEEYLKRSEQWKITCGGRVFWYKRSQKEGFNKFDKELRKALFNQESWSIEYDGVVPRGISLLGIKTVSLLEFGKRDANIRFEFYKDGDYMRPSRICIRLKEYENLKDKAALVIDCKNRRMWTELDEEGLVQAASANPSVNPKNTFLIHTNKSVVEINTDWSTFTRDRLGKLLAAKLTSRDFIVLEKDLNETARWRSWPSVSMTFSRDFANHRAISLICKDQAENYRIAHTSILSDRFFREDGVKKVALTWNASDNQITTELNLDELKEEFPAVYTDKSDIKSWGIKWNNDLIYLQKSGSFLREAAIDCLSKVDLIEAECVPNSQPAPFLGISIPYSERNYPTAKVSIKAHWNESQKKFVLDEVSRWIDAKEVLGTGEGLKLAESYYPEAKECVTSLSMDEVLKLERWEKKKIKEYPPVTIQSSDKSWKAHLIESSPSYQSLVNLKLRELGVFTIESRAHTDTTRVLAGVPGIKLGDMTQVGKRSSLSWKVREDGSFELAKIRVYSSLQDSNGLDLIQEEWEPNQRGKTLNSDLTVSQLIGTYVNDYGEEAVVNGALEIEGERLPLFNKLGTHHNNIYDLVTVALRDLPAVTLHAEIKRAQFKYMRLTWDAACLYPNGSMASVKFEYGCPISASIFNPKTSETISWTPQDPINENLNRISNEEFLRNKISPEELEWINNLAAKLGEAARAEYLAALYPDRFQYTLRHIENLRGWLGKVEISGTGDFSHPPPQLLKIEELSELRQAFFNRQRDDLYPLFKQGAAIVDNWLVMAIKDASYQEQKEYYEELREYFLRVDQIPHPVRLKDKLEEAEEFPAKHQKIGVHEIIKEKTFLLADEMGGGKTGTIVCTIENLMDSGKVRKSLIICPAQVVNVWEKVLTNQPGGYFKEEFQPKVVFIKPGSKNWEAARDAEYVVCSLEMSRGVTDGISHDDYLSGLNADFLVIDEAHNIKNPKGSDTERIFELSQADAIQKGYLVIMSGTPAPNTVRDIASQLRLLYCGRDNNSLIDFSDLHALSRAVLNGHPLVVRNFLVRKMLRRTTETCLPVGSDFYREVLSAGLSPVERLQYDSIVNNPFYEANEKLRVLRRFCLDSETKYVLLREAVDIALNRQKYTESGKVPKIVVAETNFAKGITRDSNDLRTSFSDPDSYMAARLIHDYEDSLKIFILDGKNSHHRTQILNELRDCAEPALLLTLTSVVGEGLDVSFASDGILLAPSLTVAAEEQYSRRMNRRGQTEDTHFQVLSIRDTIEQGIMEYSERKAEVVAGLLEGRPLSTEEQMLLESERRSLAQAGHLAYEILSPSEKVSWIISKIYGRGKDRIREFFESNNGRYAKDFAKYYTFDEERSFSGNTSRLVAAIISPYLRPEKITEVADVACGCRTMERLYNGINHVHVESTEINSYALETGSKILGPDRVTAKHEICAMDEQPFADSSKDIIVLSLALHYTTKHSPFKGYSGYERVRAINEIRRCLKPDGIAVITFPKKVFDTYEDFNRFGNALHEYFALSLQPETSGFASSAQRINGADYGSWVFTLKKDTDIKTKPLDQEGWKALLFCKSIKESQGQINKDRDVVADYFPDRGAYHEDFIIAGKNIRYSPVNLEQETLKAHYLQAVSNDKKIKAIVDELIAEHNGIRNIPEEKLLSISLEEVSKADQENKNSYFKMLLARYGNVQRVPVEKISEKSSVILIRGFAKKKGFYLCLGTLSSDGKTIRGSGSRYFF